MAIPTLSGSYIDETYGRLVQTDNFRNEFADGFGNPIPILIHNTSTGSYGSFFDTGSYLATSATTIYSMSLSSTDISNGVYISGSTNPYNTFVKFTNAGIYNVQFSAQFSNSDNSGQDVSIWLRKNDNSSVNDLADTTGIVTVPPRKGATNGRIIASWNYFVTVAPGDFIQLLWHAPIGNIISLETIAAGTNPTHPRTPAVILTANRVDQFLSNTGSFTGSFTGSLLGTAATASYISPTFISASAAASGFGSGGTNIDTSSFVTNSKTASFATTGSNNFIGNQTITGSLTVSGSSTFRNIGPAIFSGSVTTTTGFTGSLYGTASTAHNLANGGEIGYVPLWSNDNTLTSSYFYQSDGLLRTTSSYGNGYVGLYFDFGAQQYLFGDLIGGNNGFSISGISGQNVFYASNGVNTLFYELNASSNYIRTNADGRGIYLDFSNNSYTLGNQNGNNITINDSTNNISFTGSVIATGSFNGAFNYAVYENIDLNYPIALPVPEPPYPINEVSGSTIYVVRTAIGDGFDTNTVPLIFGNPANYTGQRAIVINMDQNNSIIVDNVNSWAARDLENNPIVEIVKRSSKEFISTGTKWIQLT